MTSGALRKTRSPKRPTPSNNIIKTVYLCITRFSKDRVANKAAALTYSTLLAIVPILAILFAIARGFGFDNLMESQVAKGLGGQTETTEILLQFCQFIPFADQERGFHRHRPGDVAMVGYQPGEQHGNHFQPHLASAESPEHVPQDYRLFLHAPAAAVAHCGIGRFVPLHEHDHQAHGRFHLAGAHREIPGQPDSLCADLVHVHRPVHLHAQHESQIETCAYLRHPGGDSLPGIPVPIHP